MSIRSIVTMGYSNGTFTIGIKFIPTLGYLSLVNVEGPGFFVKGQLYSPGFVRGQNYKPEMKEGEVFNPEIKLGEGYNPGIIKGETFNPGFQQGETD